MEIIAIPKKRSGKGGGSKKIGRNKKKCERYRLAGTREKNKARKEAKRQVYFKKRRELKREAA